jgi:hypothetical protein
MTVLTSVMGKNEDLILKVLQIYAQHGFMAMETFGRKLILKSMFYILLI